MFMNPDSLDFQRFHGTQSSKVVELDVKKGVKISENGADSSEDNERNGLSNGFRRKVSSNFLERCLEYLNSYWNIQRVECT